jgi:hypothetical protein
VLRNEGYKTLGEVIEVPEWHLLHMQNFGRVTLKELRELVAEHGLRMAFPLEMQPGKVIQVYGISVRKIGTNVIVAVKVADEWRDVIVVKDADSFSHILEPGAIKEAYRRARDASGR